MSDSQENILEQMKAMLETALTQLHQHMVSCHDASQPAQEPLTATLPTKTTETPPMPTNTNVDTLLPWDGPTNNRHNARVLCDLAGLSLEYKNIVTAVIHAESGFDNNAVCTNHDKHGNVTSKDHGICQINDFYHIGAGKEFPSVEYVIDHPEAAVNWMIDMYKKGHINYWSAYNNGSYRNFL